MYSLIESAVLNNLNIIKYIEYLLTELPQLDSLNDEIELERYLPWSGLLPDSIKSADSEILSVNKSLIIK